MKGKLIKVQDEYYITTDKQTDICYHLRHKEILKVIGVGEKSSEVHHDKGWNKPNEVVFIDTDLSARLSLKNCQAIERGYDLGKLAENHWEENNRHFKDGINPYAHRYGFKAGFQKALELMGDKKFSEQDMYKMFIYTRSINTAKKHIKKLEDKPIGEFFNDFIQSLQQTEWEVEIEMEEVAIGDKYTPSPKPKLDQDGCLILKRV